MRDLTMQEVMHVSGGNNQPAPGSPPGNVLIPVTSYVARAFAWIGAIYTVKDVVETVVDVYQWATKEPPKPSCSDPNVSCGRIIRLPDPPPPPSPT
jgi:hypothetical protein